MFKKQKPKQDLLSVFTKKPEPKHTRLKQATLAVVIGSALVTGLTRKKKP